VMVVVVVAVGGLVSGGGEGSQWTLIFPEPWTREAHNVAAGAGWPLSGEAGLRVEEGDVDASRAQLCGSGLSARGSWLPIAERTTSGIWRRHGMALWLSKTPRRAASKLSWACGRRQGAPTHQVGRMSGLRGAGQRQCPLLEKRCSRTAGVLHGESEEGDDDLTSGRSSGEGEAGVYRVRSAQQESVD
jgi:hypothetical protein